MSEEKCETRCCDGRVRREDNTTRSRQSARTCFPSTLTHWLKQTNTFVVLVQRMFFFTRRSWRFHSIEGDSLVSVSFLLPLERTPRILCSLHHESCAHHPICKKKRPPATESPQVSHTDVQCLLEQLLLHGHQVQDTHAGCLPSEALSQVPGFQPDISTLFQNVQGLLVRTGRKELASPSGT